MDAAERHVLDVVPVGLHVWEATGATVTLRYANEVRNAAEYFDEIPDTKISKEMLQLAEHILDTFVEAGALVTASGASGWGIAPHDPPPGKTVWVELAAH